MCGIFGYHGTVTPDPYLIREAARHAGRRGPHGWGFTYRTGPEAALRTMHELGPVNLDRLPDEAYGSLLGHARLATTGDWRQRDQLQPIVMGATAVAHNGVITNPHDLRPGAATDSIALAHAYWTLRLHGKVDPWEALEKLIATAQQTAWAIVVLDHTGPLYVHRHYHPLYVLRAEGGAYLSSQPFHDEATLLPEDRVVAIA